MRSLSVLFESHIQKTDGCWIWTGWMDGKGYGRMWRDGRKKSGIIRVHRFAYEHYIGPIAAGLQVDHVCHNTDPDCLGGFACLHRRCVNPDHLEAISPKANKLRGKNIMAENARKTHCKRGHEFTPENTYISRKRGHRNCRTCERLRRKGALEREAVTTA